MPVIDQSNSKNPGVPWALYAMVPFLAIASGLLTTARSATLACQHHTIDACIPVLEGLFGAVVAVTVFAWLATSRGRQRSLASGVVVTTTSIALWAVFSLLWGPIVCPDPGADDVICNLALPAAAISFIILAAASWRMQDPIES